MSDPASAPNAQPESSRDPWVGAVVGERYKILARIGEGGMGAVYRAEHTLMKKTVALKLLHPEFGLMEDAARRFEREAQSASRLSHPHIVAVTDFGRGATGELYLVMEHVAGRLLATAIEESGPFRLDRALRLCRQMLQGLEHAHAQGVIHRDLKPANIMLATASDPAGGETVKILDFGIAKMSQGAEGENALTQGAMVFGTPSYMSPEQATAQEVDARADVYSCGIMLYEMLTGRKPFIANDLVKVMAMQVTAAPPPFSKVARDLALPNAVEAVVMRALEKDRTRRFASATEFRQAIEALERGGLASLVGRLPPLWTRASGTLSEAIEKMTPPVRRRSAVGGVLAVVAALTFVPMLCTREGTAPTHVPPPPKPVQPELKIPVKRIEEAMAQGQLTEARVLVMQQISLHPKVGRLRFLLGNLEFASKNTAAGLDAYREALRLDPGLRGDAAVMVTVKTLLGDRRFGRDALDLMISGIGKPAAAVLTEIASEDRRQDFRQAARTACDELGCAKKVDQVQSYTLDLHQARTCDQRRAAVQKLGETGDDRAIEPLRKARRSRGVLAGLFGGGNDCIRKDIDAALAALGYEEPVRPRRGR